MKNYSFQCCIFPQEVTLSIFFCVFTEALLVMFLSFATSAPVFWENLPVLEVQSLTLYL